MKMNFTEEEDVYQLIEDIVDSPTESNLKKKTYFYPLESRDHFIETFYELVLKDLKKLEKSSSTTKRHFNLSVKQKRAHDKLWKNSDIIIKKGDKGGDCYYG